MTRKSYASDSSWRKATGGKLPPNYGSKWSEWEEQELAAMWNEGGRPGKIAWMLGRTVSSCMARLAILRDQGMV